MDLKLHFAGNSEKKLSPRGADSQAVMMSWVLCRQDSHLPFGTLTLHRTGLEKSTSIYSLALWGTVSLMHHSVPRVPFLNRLILKEHSNLVLWGFLLQDFLFISMVCLYKPMEMPCSAAFRSLQRAVQVVLGRIKATDVFRESIFCEISYIPFIYYGQQKIFAHAHLIKLRGFGF